jgi:two-component system response regulator QseB
MRPPLVLVVQHDPAAVRSATLRLDRAGFRCVPAYTGRQAIDALLAGGYDAAVVDLDLPSGDGPDIARVALDRNVASVVLVARTRDSVCRRLVQRRGVSLLIRPYTASHLVELVASTLRRCAA